MLWVIARLSDERCVRGLCVSGVVLFAVLDSRDQFICLLPKHRPLTWCIQSHSHTIEHAGIIARSSPRTGNIGNSQQRDVVDALFRKEQRPSEQRTPVDTCCRGRNAAE